MSFFARLFASKGAERGERSGARWIGNGAVWLLDWLAGRDGMALLLDNVARMCRIGKTS